MRSQGGGAPRVAGSIPARGSAEQNGTTRYRCSAPRAGCTPRGRSAGTRSSSRVVGPCVTRVAHAPRSNFVRTGPPGGRLVPRGAVRRGRGLTARRVCRAAGLGGQGTMGRMPVPTPGRIHLLARDTPASPGRRRGVAFYARWRRGHGRVVGRCVTTGKAHPLSSHCTAGRSRGEVKAFAERRVDYETLLAALAPSVPPHLLSHAERPRRRRPESVTARISA